MLWPSLLNVSAPRIATLGEYFRSIILDPVVETTSYANVDVLNLSSMIGCPFSPELLYGPS